MKKGEIVKTDILKGNSLEGISILVEEIQEDAFSKRHRTIRGRRVYKNGRVGVGVVDCPADRVVL